MSERSCRDQRIARVLLVLAVLVTNVAIPLLLLLGDRDRGSFSDSMFVCWLASIACCMTAMWLSARARGARHPLLWSLWGIVGLAGVLLLCAILIIRKWVHEARDALRARRAAHGG